MKKILMLAALPLIILLFSFKSYAAYTAPDGNDYEYYYETNCYTGTSHQNSDNKIWSNYKLVASDFYLRNNLYPILGFYYNNGVYALKRVASSNSGNPEGATEYGTTGNPNLSGQFYITTIAGSTPSTANFLSTSISDASIEHADNLTEMIELLTTPEIDWDTIYYNPLIPVPKLNIWYLYQVESYREDGVANFTANIDVPDSTEFYVELAWKYSYPQSIRVYPSDMKGTPAYDYEYYQSSDLISIYSLQDMQQAINLHVTGSSLQTEWQAAYDEFIEATTFYTNLSDVPNGWLANARLKYVNSMGTQIPLYGNRLEVFARFWTLSEDNKVVVGKWYHWQSAKGSATEEVPETYVNYQELPGYAGTVETVPTDDENTYTGTGTSTGEQATTIINYAPNYPDYPTAVSYNHDNILLQMIQTSKQLPQFFGQFTNFLAITLAFIDPGVWAIIGFGFTCCIVIMIIKVL